MVARPATGGRFLAPERPEGLVGPHAELPLLGLSLGARQERAFVEIGLGFVEGEAIDDVDGPRIVVRQDVAISSQAVLALLEAGRQRAEDTSWRCGGRAGALARELGLGDDGPWLVYLHAPGPVTAERLAAATSVEIDPKERLIQLPVAAAQFGADVLELPLTDRLVLPAGHWLQLLWANLLGLGPFLWRALAGRNAVQMVWRLGWAVLSARSTDPWRVGARLVHTGRRCRVHPTATVEGCWLGEGVEIGAHAVVRGSVLADGAVVEDQALVEFSVLDVGSRVQRQALFKFSLARRSAAAAGAMQLGVLDRDATLEYGAVLMDMRLGQGVLVRRRGGLVDAPLGLAGVCVGEGTQVGVGVVVAAGRVLPPGLVVLAGSENVVTVVPDDVEGTVVVRRGRLEPA